MEGNVLMQASLSVRGFPEYEGEYHIQIKMLVGMVKFHKDFKTLVGLYYVSLWYKWDKRDLDKWLKDMWWHTKKACNSAVEYEKEQWRNWTKIECAALPGAKTEDTLFTFFCYCKGHY